MSKLAPTPKSGSVQITNTYETWRASQTWLAEMVRAVASRLFAQANGEFIETGDKSSFAVHWSALTAQVAKLFGALFDESDPELSISWVIDLLVHLEDLGDIGRGYCLPRESRVVRITEDWGRIAGGLPLELSEHCEDGIDIVPCESIGRVVKLAKHFSQHDDGAEHSDVFRWVGRSAESLFAELCDELPERPASPPPEGTVYYNSQLQRLRTRGERWQSKFPGGEFVVARTGAFPAHYSVHIRRQENRAPAWYEVTRNEARRWVLLAEKIAGTMNRIPMRAEEHGIVVFLPDMLPKAWTTALFTCASSVVPAEKGWTLKIQDGGKGLAEAVLRSANIQMI
ncbi:MAG TPA: hypothetical protein VFV96_10750 [Verrucomicrobiae bacterium]|nr:hypothetical protein [Verrucomicrobiae bacterium]